MTLPYCSEIALPNIGDLSKFISFIDTDGPINDVGVKVLWRSRETKQNKPLPQQYSTDYPNLFDDMQKELGLEPQIEEVIMFGFPKQSEMKGYNEVHKDGVPGFPILRDYAIIVPIVNCDKIKISWFKDKDPTKTKLADNSLIVSADPENDLVKVHECYLTAPMIINIGEWHCGTTESDEPAYFLTPRFSPEFDYFAYFGSPRENR